MVNLVIFAVLFAGLFSVGAVWICKKKRNSLKNTLKSWGLNSDVMKYNAVYPSLGIKIASDYAIKTPISVHSWVLDYRTPDFVSIAANGFWAANWSILIDAKKASLTDGGKYEVYEYLVKHKIIQPNSNLH